MGIMVKMWRSEVKTTTWLGNTALTKWSSTVCVDVALYLDTVFVVHSLWRDAKTISRDFHFYFAINS